VLVFFAATGRANAAVLTELEVEVRSAIEAAQHARVDIEGVEADLDRLADTTLPPSAAASASRMMRGWVSNVPEDTTHRRPSRGPTELKA
jgi:hypothetical protein